jgi:hypothetical protein
VTIAPPQNLEAEQAVLGAVLLSDTALPALIADVELRPDHFYREQHGRIYRAMLDLQARGEPVDALTLVEHLKRTRQLDEVGGRAEVELLTAGVPDVGNFRQYGRIVREEARERLIRGLARGVADGNGTSAELRTELRSALDDDPAGSPLASSSGTTAREWLARPRPRPEALITSPTGGRALNRRENLLLVAGPPDAGKSLALLDLIGLAASDRGGTWLNLHVAGGQRVLYVPAEGAEEDVAERLQQLVPDDAQERLVIWDRWREGEPTPTRLAARVRRREIDVVAIDTVNAWLDGAWAGGRYDISKGIPETAQNELEGVRRQSGRPVTFFGAQHTRKRDNSRGRREVDEVEELAGTFAKKADCIVVIRKTGERHERKISYARFRNGVPPFDAIGRLPKEGETGPPRIVVDAGVASEAQRKAEERDAKIATDILDLLAAKPDLSQNAIKSGVSGNESAITRVLDKLVSEGRVERYQHGQARRHRLPVAQSELAPEDVS